MLCFDALFTSSLEEIRLSRSLLAALLVSTVVNLKIFLQQMFQHFSSLLPVNPTQRAKLSWSVRVRRQVPALTSHNFTYTDITVSREQNIVHIW